ncbi:hypothetical protein ABL78_2816 [Leptomonas seymouri]|uniref:Uncharacterized protein n=1 Tax=Leptomonas seymouri TaxID=5684 RepID=A0A0N0P6V9_LEPSE|nr:hypothetical protein ABL78_2816 [Leptomonas seymouri]|eukprot:KPI88086.1 hypothetical protein ABL78_2816 [Leptomonas seymouri]
MPHPFLLPQRQQQPVLNPTMSGGSTSFDSAYGGLYDSGSFIGQNSFYGNMGSFFGSFGGAMESRPFSQSRAPISLDAQCAPFMNSYYYGEGYTDITATSANTSFGGEYEDGDTLPNRTTSSGRILRRVVSFSDVPPLNEENQRTVANTPKRVGFRRMNRQFSNIENERDASASPVQQPTPEQPQQQSFIAISSNSPMFCGYGLTHPRNPVANAYGVNQSRSPYSMNVANYGAPQPPAPPASSSMGFAQPWYSMYGGTNYTTFSNGRPMMMQPRPMMNGFYY